MVKLGFRNVFERRFTGMVDKTYVAMTGFVSKGFLKPAEISFPELIGPAFFFLTEDNRQKSLHTRRHLLKHPANSESVLGITQYQVIGRDIVRIIVVLSIFKQRERFFDHIG